MTSIYKPLIKIFLVPLALTVGIGFSAFSTVKESQGNLSQYTNNIDNSKPNFTKQATDRSKSQYEKKFQRDFNRLMLGNKQFKPYFLHSALTAQTKCKEV